jgi:hypothetical protein
MRKMSKKTNGIRTKCSNCQKEISYNASYKAYKAYFYYGKDYCYDCLLIAKLNVQNRQKLKGIGKQVFCKRCDSRIIKKTFNKYGGYCRDCFNLIKMYGELENE